MLYIVKGSEPPELAKWKRGNRSSPQNLHYGNLGATEIRAIKVRLLNEQGYLCAYTMQRIHSIDDCHIEHWQPQNLHPELSLDYGNMLACIPQSGGDVSLGYGAPIKGGKSADTMLSPLRQDCESRLHYRDDGGVQPLEPNDETASATIDLIKLNHDTLKEYRRAAIGAWGLSIRRGRSRCTPRPLSATQAKDLANTIMNVDADGCRTAYCTAIAQVAMRFSDKEQARSRRTRAGV